MEGGRGDRERCEEEKGPPGVHRTHSKAGRIPSSQGHLRSGCCMLRSPSANCSNGVFAFVFRERSLMGQCSPGTQSCLPASPEQVGLRPAQNGAAGPAGASGACAAARIPSLREHDTR